jgi:hypothetical protein
VGVPDDTAAPPGSGPGSLPELLEGLSPNAPAPWSNGLTAGGAADSPWARDVPVPPPPTLPAAWHLRTGAARDPVTRSTTLPSETVSTSSTETVEAAGRNGGPRRRRLFALAAVVGLVLSGVAGTRVIDSSNRSSNGADTGSSNDAARNTSRATLPGSASSGAPSDTRGPGDAIPLVAQPATASTTLAIPADEADPTWTTETIELDERFATMTEPTEVIALTRDGTLRVIDLPTGAMHSVAGNGADGTGLAVGDRSVVLQLVDDSTVRYELSTLGGPTVAITIPGGIAQVSPRPGTDQFVVTSNELGGRSLPNLYLLDSAGLVTDVADGPFAGIEPWRLRFLPSTGDAIVTDTGGTYVIDDGGVTMRISTGDLVALGSNHIVVRECDEALRCSYVRLDTRSGERREVRLGELATYEEFDSSVVLSPDGSALTYIDWMNSGARRLIDLETGAGSDIDLRNNDYYSSTWSADSSGVFSIDDGQLVFLDRRSGDTVVVAPGTDLGSIVAVATRTLPPRETG